MKVNKGKIYTWKSKDIPVYVLSKAENNDMVYIQTHNEDVHHIDKKNLIDLTFEHQNLDWCRLLNNETN
tara:strand:+ start:955 stop:1161 length:207 start_codon:yes stop_codon:yes gene_type:complete